MSTAIITATITMIITTITITMAITIITAIAANTSMDVPAMKCYHKNTGREKL